MKSGHGSQGVASTHALLALPQLLGTQRAGTLCPPNVPSTVNSAQAVLSTDDWQAHGPACLNDDPCRLPRLERINAPGLLIALVVEPRPYELPGLPDQAPRC